jgi:hypothetical protein
MVVRITASATSGALNLKIFFIAVEPPAKTRAEPRIIEKVDLTAFAELNPDSVIRFSAAFVRCLSAIIRPLLSEGDLHPLECRNFRPA